MPPNWNFLSLCSKTEKMSHPNVHTTETIQSQYIACYALYLAVRLLLSVELDLLGADPLLRLHQVHQALLYRINGSSVADPFHSGLPDRVAND